MKWNTNNKNQRLSAFENPCHQRAIINGTRITLMLRNAD